MNRKENRIFKTITILSELNILGSKQIYSRITKYVKQ